ncbi:helix-turn-helix domain-containing protein [Photorhabdus sp. SF281]
MLRATKVRIYPTPEQAGCYHPRRFSTQALSNNG